MNALYLEFLKKDIYPPDHLRHENQQNRRDENRRKYQGNIKNKKH